MDSLKSIEFSRESLYQSENISLNVLKRSNIDIVLGVFMDWGKWVMCVG